MGKSDQTAWKAIQRMRRPKGILRYHKGLALSGRPKDFGELGEAIRQGAHYRAAFLNFLAEFYFFKEASFFRQEPPWYFSTVERAFLAGVSEYLCHRFRLRPPKWLAKPEYFLKGYWNKSADDTGEAEFRRRNIGFNPLHLLSL